MIVGSVMVSSIDTSSYSCGKAESPLMIMKSKERLSKIPESGQGSNSRNFNAQSSEMSPGSRMASSIDTSSHPYGESQSPLMILKAKESSANNR